MTPDLRYAVLPCLLFAGIAAGPPSAAPAPPGEAATMHGVLRYKVRGLSAVQGGFLSGAIMGLASGVGVQTAAVNMLKLLGGAAKLSGNASMAEMHDYLRTGKGFDFSGAPVSAGYDVELDFVLESDATGNYRLKSGRGRYSGSTDADVTVAGDRGNIHRFTDRFRGQGSVRLDATNAAITLTRSGKGKDQRVRFEVNVGFPVTLVGKTTWSAMGGASVISREDKGDVATWTMSFLGSRHSQTESNSAWHTNVVYSRSGPIDSVLRGRETWQDLADSGELVEWELWDACSARIETPEHYDELVFDDGTPGRIRRVARADVQPSFWDQDLHWSFMPMSGSDIEPPPLTANGNDFDLVYTRLPPKNSAFASWLMKAEFATARAKQAGCRNPEPHEVIYLYPREAANNPGPSARAPEGKGTGPDPNWFFYWQQTAAAQGRAADTRYGRGAPSCTDSVGGYYSLGTSYVVVCDLAPVWGFGFSHPWVDLVLDGIDTYAGVVAHEWKHHDDFKKWWPNGHSTVLDTDNDRIPDLLEPSVAVPAPLNGKHKFFDNNKRDTLGRGFEDEHYFAYMAMADWKPGSADHQDWACPGHQATVDCR